MWSQAYLRPDTCHLIYNPQMVFRSDNRSPDQLRPVTILPDFIHTAEGSALIEVGNTRVICTASVEETVPAFLRNSGKGWVYEPNTACCRAPP